MACRHGGASLDVGHLLSMLGVGTACESIRVLVPGLQVLSGAGFAARIWDLDRYRNVELERGDAGFLGFCC